MPVDRGKGMGEGEKERQGGLSTEHPTRPADGKGTPTVHAGEKEKGGEGNSPRRRRGGSPRHSATKEKDGRGGSEQRAIRAREVEDAHTRHAGWQGKGKGKRAPRA